MLHVISINRKGLTQIIFSNLTFSEFFWSSLYDGCQCLLQVVPLGRDSSMAWELTGGANAPPVASQQGLVFFQHCTSYKFHSIFPVLIEKLHMLQDLMKTMESTHSVYLQCYWKTHLKKKIILRRHAPLYKLYFVANEHLFSFILCMYACKYVCM